MSKSMSYAGCMISVLLIGCQSLGKKSDLQLIQTTKPIEIRLSAKAGQEELTRYFSHARIHSFEGSQLVHEQDEMVDFKVREKVLKVKEPSGPFTVLTSTIYKDGTADLHDLAFPEKGEEIEFVFGNEGQVLRAGDYPANSVFYVPPIPLPKEPVQVGDTWTMDHAWIGIKNNIPLGVHIIAILKNVYACGADQCADIEISGQVDVIGLNPSNQKFSSRVWGRMLVAVSDSTVLWSETRSRERVAVKDQGTEVWSCLVGNLESPNPWGWSRLQKTCDPVEKPVDATL
jgi:hypothetical protein